MKRIFCLIGKTGSGKSSYLLDIMKMVADDYTLSSTIFPLIYYTSRPKRENEINGKDYFFNTSFKEDDIKDPNVIEYRCYNTIQGPWYYYTTKQCLEEHDNYIAAVSIEQLANFIEAAYIDNTIPMEIYIINIECPLETRFKRVMTNRCKTEDDLLELCRRVLKEREEFADNEVNTKLSIISDDNKISIDNNSSLLRQANTIAILNWINSKIV